MNDVGIALLGSKFMGKAHSNAWSQVSRFFDVPSRPVLQYLAARDAEYLESFARRWGWNRWTTNWTEAVTDEEVDLVDIGTPNYLHHDQSIAALEAGKHVACEKPLARTLSDAEAMAAAAKRAGLQTFVWHNYRRVPAVALARQLVQEGRIGRIYHVRASYLQSWGGPDAPLDWHFSREQAGSGAHGDLNSHIVDMARFVTSDEVTEIIGAAEERFIDERPLPDAPSDRGRSTVDDAVLFLARFESGAVGSFEGTRLATGMKNSNRLTVQGDLGALSFDFEAMNELRFFDATESPRLQGWRTILVTGPDHPYVSNWWPDGHWLGYDHTFTHQASDILEALAGNQPLVPLPDFEDALITQRVLEAALISARERAPIAISDLIP